MSLSIKSNILKEPLIYLSLNPKSTSSGWLHHPSGRGVARQSPNLESVTWRLPRHFVPRNDESSRGSLAIRLILAGQMGGGIVENTYKKQIWRQYLTDSPK